MRVERAGPRGKQEGRRHAPYPVFCLSLAPTGRRTAVRVSALAEAKPGVTKLGFAGLGIMGVPMTQNLMKVTALCTAAAQRVQRTQRHTRSRTDACSAHSSPTGTGTHPRTVPRQPGHEHDGPAAKARIRQQCLGHEHVTMKRMSCTQRAHGQAHTRSRAMECVPLSVCVVPLSMRRERGRYLACVSMCLDVCGCMCLCVCVRVCVCVCVYAAGWVRGTRLESQS